MKNGKDHVLIVFILLSIVYLTSAVLLPQQNDFFTDLQTLNPRYQPQRHANLDINDPCTWQEVTCENNGNYSVVTELRVSIQLVPDSIGNLTSLRSLIMRGEVGLRYLPATISNFKDTLQVLELANTGFTDESIRSILVFNRLTRLVLSGILPLRNLPRGFSSSFPLLETLILPAGIRLLPVTYNLQNLRRLIAPGYVGEVDEENVCGLPNLEVLSLAEYNGRSRQLPDCVGGLRSLILLDLTGSMFTRFPNIWTLDKLEELYMQRSYLIGNIPNEIGRLRSLKILNIENANFLVGTLPASIGGLTNLEIFNVATNRVNGSIPASFGNLRQLRVLNLDNNIMGGAIPSELGNCASLTDFIIGNNAFSGTLPSELGNIASMQNFFVRNNLLTGQLPDSFGNWTDLVIFSVQNNQFTGTIPDDYSKWSRLMTMQLDNNQFSGQFPEGFANMNDIITFSASFNNFEGPLFDFTGCRNLQTFQVQFNALQGTIPQALDTLVSLTSLQLQSNQLEGTIPATITRLIQLSEINFGNNKLSGTIPIGLLDRARIIDLSHNMLEGTLPINQTISAAMLMLEHNRLTGQIPDIQASSMDLIDLSHNFFSGTLPQLPARLTSISLASNQISGTFNGQYLRFALLSMLDLSNNLIEGRLPEFPPESTLRHFDISYNSMRGQIPASMITRSIQNIILSHNDFTGPLPTFAPFTNLHTLRVDNNGLSGGIGQALFTGTLEVLDLSTNLFGGMFPTITSRPRRLRELRLHQNFFTGIIPPSLASMISLEVLDLSFNAFVGQIPPQLEALRNLRVLDVSFNRLTGVIPQTLVNLLNLETLNLERNRIEGSIPQYLGDIFSLHYLSLAGNLFTGEIPSMFDSLRSINGLDLSRNRLSGTIPHSLFSLQRVRRIDLSHNSLTGTVSRQIANLRALEDLDLSLNQLSGTIPSLANLRNVISINITGNAFSGCLQLPDQFKVSTNSTARCSIGSNQFCCSLASYSCEVTDKCPINDMLRVPKGSTVDLHDADHFEKLVLDDGGTLVVQHNNRIDIECIDARGTIAIDMSEYEESHLETTFLFYTCGSTEDLNIVAKGKECTITTSVSERAGKLALSASLTCPDTSAAQGVIIAIVISVTGGCILFIVIGAVTYRYFRGKRRVEQLLNRVELLTLTTKNGSDDQFSLPQWHAPEDYSLKPVEDLPIQLTNTKFDFGTKGNLLQVDSMYKDTFRVQNRAKLTQSRGLVERLLEKSLRVNFHPVQSTKYQLTIDPFEIDIRDKGYVDVTLMLQMKMTTRTNISLWVEVPELKQFSLLEFVCASEPSPWIDIDEVDGITEALGEGGFGAVYKAKYRGQTIAFKKLKFQDMNIQQFEEFNREVQMMMNLHHRCIVQFIGASKVPGKLAILTEFVSGGNLQELLNSRPSLDTGLKLKIALDVAEALQFLHANNILHRDIKAENVLVASTAKEASVNVKLTDFGTARSIVEEVTMKFTKGIGTPTYMAPEIMENKRYEKGADIYSFGILLWTIMAQQMPYSHLEHPWQIANMVIDGGRLPIPPSTPVAVAELINKCWAQSPDDRPNMDQVVKELNFILDSKM